MLRRYLHGGRFGHFWGLLLQPISQLQLRWHSDCVVIRTVADSTVVGLLVEGAILA